MKTTMENCSSKKINEMGILALVPMNYPSPVGYMNVYEEGDLWIKTKGCDDCPPEQRLKCCGNCRMVSEHGCFLHMTNKGQNKPISCVVQPRPDKHRPNCVIEIKCVKGKYLNKIHRLKDPKNVFHDE